MYYCNRILLTQVLAVSISILFASPGNAAETEATTTKTSRTTRIENNLGANYWQKGATKIAIAVWKKEAELYRLQGKDKKIAETNLKIAQGYINLGQVNLAQIELEKIISTSKQPSLIARAWKQLGNAYSRNGEFDEAEQAYTKSLEIERELPTLNNLVILLQKQRLQALLQAQSSRAGEETENYLARAKSYGSIAKEKASLALTLSQTEQSSSSIRALIEWGKLSSTGLSTRQIERGRKLLTNLSPSRNKVFLAINWSELDSEQTKYWLTQAREIATEIGDTSAESYALLELGLLCERLGDMEQALKYATTAQIKAQSSFDFNSLYRAQWLAGRIQKKWGNRKIALANYRNTLTSLDAFNQSFTTISVERRIDFGTEIEPIYREMLELLLDKDRPERASLEESLLVSKKLKLAQLQNYFGFNCLDIERNSLKDEDTLVGENKVRFNSILLENEAHFLLELPNGRLIHSKASTGKQEITKMATDWYNNLRQTDTRRFLLLAEELYNLMIRPFNAELAKIDPTTIIFVHDGILRNLPMAALYDTENQEFLAQQWASVSSIGLNINIVPSSNQTNTNASAFGLGVGRGKWSPLEQVETEVRKVVGITGGQIILNEKFTTEKFAQELRIEEYSIIHLATHGYFGGTSENSFILAYDGLLSARELAENIAKAKADITLLVLSACETAISSDRSALGLAGVALFSGVENVLGSFWQVKDDEQLELIEDFYLNIKEQNLDLANAVRQMQIKQIERAAHPSKWAALNIAER